MCTTGPVPACTSNGVIRKDSLAGLVLAPRLRGPARNLSPPAEQARQRGLLVHRPLRMRCRGGRRARVTALGTCARRGGILLRERRREGCLAEHVRLAGDRETGGYLLPGTVRGGRLKVGRGGGGGRGIGQRVHRRIAVHGGHGRLVGEELARGVGGGRDAELVMIGEGVQLAGDRCRVGVHALEEMRWSHGGQHVAHLGGFLFDGVPVVGGWRGLWCRCASELAEGVLEGVRLGGVVAVARGGVDDKVGIDLVWGRDEDGLAVHTVELEIGVVEGRKVGTRLELLKGEGALHADLGGVGGGGGGGGGGGHTWTSNMGSCGEGSIGGEAEEEAFIRLGVTHAVS